MKNNLYAFFLFFITGLMSCSHHSGLYEHAEKIMSQHPDSVLTLLSTIQDVNDLSEKDRAMYYLLLTEAQNKTYVKPTSDSLIAISTQYFDKTEDWGRKAKAWYYRGRINQDLGDALHAQDFYLKALQEESEVEDYALLGRIYNSIGMLYTYQEVYEKALTLGSQSSKLSIYKELGNLYIEKGEYPKGYYFLNETLKYPLKENMLESVCLALGKLYQKTSQIDSAYHFLNICIHSSRLQTRAGAYYFLAQLEKGQKRWEKYAENQMRYEMLRDSISLVKQTESIRRVENIYDYHQSEAKLLHATILLERIKVNNLYMCMIVVGCLIGVCVVIVVSYIQLKKKKIRLQEHQDRLVALKKKREEDQARINENEEKIADLERLLQQSSVAYSEKEKELMALQKMKLEAEIQRLECVKTESQLLIDKFCVSDIYYRFHIKDEWRPKEEDWCQLFKAIDEAYDNFTHRLMGVAPKLTTTELRVSCLVKANVPPVTIAMLIVTTPTNVSMIRKRLYEKIHSDTGSSEKFDRFIREF